MTPILTIEAIRTLGCGEILHATATTATVRFNLEDLEEMARQTDAAWELEDERRASADWEADYEETYAKLEDAYKDLDDARARIEILEEELESERYDVLDLNERVLALEHALRVLGYDPDDLNAVEAAR